MPNEKAELPVIPIQHLGPAMKALKLQHRLFVLNYVALDGNGTQAAMAAGYASGSAHVTATRMLKNAKMHDAITEWSNPLSQKAAFTAERRLTKLSDIVETEATDEVKIDHQIRAMDIANKMEGNYVHKIEIGLNATWQDFVREEGAALREADKLHPEWRDGYEESLRNKTLSKKRISGPND